MRFCEKIMPYNFTLKWEQGKTHCIADTLSRAPVFSATELEEDKAELEDPIHCLCKRKYPIIDIIEDATEDKNYVKATAQVLNLGKDKNPKANTPLAEYTRTIPTENGIMLKGGAKIVVP